MAELLLFDGGRAFFSGDDAPQPLRYLLHSAMQSTDAETTERLLLEARSRWPQHSDAHLALYKFYFVAARYIDAERAVWRSLREAAALGNFSYKYRRLRGDSADWSQRSGASRWYLFNLKALGVIRLRRARAIASQRVLEKLLELDPVDEIGGGAFLMIARAVNDTERDNEI